MLGWEPAQGRLSSPRYEHPDNANVRETIKHENNRRAGRGYNNAAESWSQCSRDIDANTTERNSCCEFSVWKNLRYDRLPGWIVEGGRDAKQESECEQHPRRRNSGNCCDCKPANRNCHGKL